MLKKTLLISTVVAMLTVTGNARGNHGGGHGHHGGNNGSQQATQIELTQEQKDSLKFMAEEEKIARDVYEYLYSKWNSAIFSNIAKSEQKHIDAVLRVLENSNVEAPLTMDSRGEYENEELQELYNALIVEGNQSPTDALEVGVAIEIKDIDDLENYLNGEITTQMQRTYSRLLRGSYNHLNAFKRQLEN